MGLGGHYEGPKSLYSGIYLVSKYFQEKEPLRSFGYMEKACQIDPDSISHSILGKKYFHGEGVPKNTVRALAYFYVAKAMGNERSDKWIEICSKNATKTQLSNAEDLAAKLWVELQEKIKN